VFVNFALIMLARRYSAKKQYVIILSFLISALFGQLLIVTFLCRL